MTDTGNAHHILKEAEGHEWVSLAVQTFTEAINKAIATNGRCLFALSGGSTPWPVFVELAKAPIAWEKVTLLQADDRIVEGDSTQRNLLQQQELFAETGAGWLPLPVEEVLAVVEQGASLSNPDDPAIAAVLGAFGESLLSLAGNPPELDVVHLGLGSDGHTASLIPGDPAVDDATCLVAITKEPYQGTYRMTLGRSVLDVSKQLVWLTKGSDKAPMVERLIANDATIPAGLLNAQNSTIISEP